MNLLKAFKTVQVDKRSLLSQLLTTFGLVLTVDIQFSDFLLEVDKASTVKMPCQARSSYRILLWSNLSTSVYCDSGYTVRHVNPQSVQFAHLHYRYMETARRTQIQAPDEVIKRI